MLANATERFVLGNSQLYVLFILYFSAPACSTTAQYSSVTKVSPSRATVTRGEMVTYKCNSKLILTSGQLKMACGDQGQLLGEQPNCTGKS